MVATEFVTNLLLIFLFVFFFLQIPEKSFKLLLEYLINLKGNGKNFVVQKCENVMKAKEKNSSSADPSLEISYQRARSALQYIQ